MPSDPACSSLLATGPLSLLAVASLCASTAGIPSIKSVFIDMSYPPTPTATAPRDMALSVDAVVAPALLVGFERPQEAGACLAELAKDERAVRALWSYGSCMANGGTRPICLPRLP